MKNKDEMDVRKQIEDYAKKKWGSSIAAGLDHFQRVYKLAKKLDTNYDDEILHAAAFLHDIEQGEDHGGESAKSAINFLNKISFPSEKVPIVAEAIKNHARGGKPISIEAKMIYDADRLDFLGATGIARLSGMTAEDWFGISTVEELKTKIWQGFCSECASNLILEKSKELAKDKIAFLKLAINQLDKEIK